MGQSGTAMIIKTVSLIPKPACAPICDPYNGALGCACFAEQGPGLFWLVISGNLGTGSSASWPPQTDVEPTPAGARPSTTAVVGPTLPAAGSGASSGL